MDGGAWWAAVHGVAKSRTRLSDFTFTFLFHALEKEMTTHSSVLAWRIPGTGEPGGLPSMGLHRVGHDWSDLAAAAAAAIGVILKKFSLVHYHGIHSCEDGIRQFLWFYLDPVAIFRLSKVIHSSQGDSDVLVTCPLKKALKDPSRTVCSYRHKQNVYAHNISIKEGTLLGDLC